MGENDREVVRMLLEGNSPTKSNPYLGPRKRRFSHQVQGKLLAGEEAESLASLGENKSFLGRIVGFTPEIN